MEYQEKYYSLLNKVKKTCEKGGWNRKGIGGRGRCGKRKERRIKYRERKISKKPLKKEGVISS